MKTFQVSGILLVSLCILHNQGFEAKCLHRNHGRSDHGKHRTVVPQQDDPTINQNYVAVAKLRGYIVKKHKKAASTIIKNSTALLTEDKMEDSFLPVSRGIVHFKVRADNDVLIALSCSAAQRDPMYEVFIGGWSKARSVIDKSITETDVANAVTPIILYGDEFRGFWVRWYNGTISAGNEGNSTPFLGYTDSENLMIEYVGVRTGLGASITWTIEKGDVANWVAVKRNTQPPHGAYVAGNYEYSPLGIPIYVIRANYLGGLIPGSLALLTSFMAKNKNGDWDDIESYEVLCDFRGGWQHTSGNATIPSNAVVAGQTKDGEPLYVGRFEKMGSLIVGRVQAKNERMLCFAWYGERERESDDFEILIA